MLKFLYVYYCGEFYRTIIYICFSNFPFNILIFCNHVSQSHARIGSVRMSRSLTGFGTFDCRIWWDSIECDWTCPWFRHLHRNPNFQMWSAEVFRRNFFPLYKKACSQSKLVCHWSSPDQDTGTYTLIPDNKDYSTQHGQPIFFLILRSYAPHLIALYPQNYYTITTSLHI